MAMTEMERRGVGLALLVYMSERMGMDEAMTDQEQNQICGHMHQFACNMIEAFQREADRKRRKKAERRK
jgi:hypothetical protein